jgi:plastocyanin
VDAALRRLFPAGLATILFLVTACAGSGSASSTPASASDWPSPSNAPSEAAVHMTSEPADEAPAGAVVLAAGPGSKFTPTEVEATADEALTFFIDMTAAAGYFHNFNIGPALPPAPALATTTDIFAPDESAVVTVSGLEPGTYQFWCSYAEHYKYGMHGTLTVE